MQIRSRLTFQFIVIVAVTQLFASLAIYFFSAQYRRDTFFDRLQSKALNTAKLLIEVEEVDAALLRKIETGNPSSLPHEKIIIYDYTNEIVYSSDESVEIRVTPAMLDEIRLKEEIKFRQGGFEGLGFLFADRFDRFVVVAGARDIYGMSKLKNLRTILVIVFSVTLLMLLMGGRIFAGRALKPISGIVRQVDEIHSTSLNMRVDEGVENDEITQLARTFNKMLDRIEKAFKVQKTFIANASHELRNPLTAISGQLEVIMLKDHSREDYKKTILSVLDDMRNLNSISNRLLLLAQASSETPDLSIRTQRVDELIWAVREELLKRNPGYHIDIVLDDRLADERYLTVTGDDHLLKTAFLNLMDNGCKYSSDQRVEVILEPGDGELHLRFLDRGIGIAPQDLGDIFEPFHRGSNAQTVKGHGIGLSLAERVIRIHGGRISVDSALNRGTTFSVLLPYA